MVSLEHYSFMKLIIVNYRHLDQHSWMIKCACLHAELRTELSIIQSLKDHNCCVSYLTMSGQIRPAG